ncbi:MAG: hypothetical protein COU06_00160 [Candidatus Harrisonbacteria bacterium CG10_big_fil_rev_8_21_14_0_10_38_8]|uniref:DUF5671 domain-containing protein n=1 Tax=Candidatus Harrisonbacteria bacterium CG10_big_fil_rev_8_21_14_0_10_38_8 TaxID=1974582 RepID=A0A2M6WKP0_9BACT|nr:MAG: hypothetical protein COU06_00160 [Candidatus Harrisonbacteria bacterium CG10_big_fil_rev_8_21_14_0_10_38_8]
MKKLLSIAILALTPVMVSAQASVPSADDTILAGGLGGIELLIIRIANWMFTLLLVLAVLFIILAAYKYLLSQGGDGVKEAHKMLVYAAVAIAVAFLARGIVFVVEQLVSSGGSSGSSIYYNDGTRSGGATINDDNITIRRRGSNSDVQVSFPNPLQ